MKVDGSLLRILNPDVPVIVDGMEITAINVPRSVNITKYNAALQHTAHYTA